MLRNIGALVFLVLVSNVLYGYMRAEGRFRNIAICSSSSYAIFLGMLLILGPSLTLRLTFISALLQFTALDLFLLYCVRKHLSNFCWRFFVISELREFSSYAWRAQVMSISALAILETDSLVVASILPIEALGYLAIGAQVANAVRSIPMFVLPPLLTRLTNAFSRDGELAAIQFASRANALWVSGLALYGATALGAVAFGVRGWAGHFPSAELVAVLLTLGNCVNLLTGVSTSLCRAIGKPGIEARYGVLLLVANLSVSWPSTQLWGLAGATASTAAVQVLGFLYFHRLLRKAMPTLDGGISHIRWASFVVILLLSVFVELPTLLLGAPSIVTFGLAIVGAAIVLSVVSVQVRRSAKNLLPA